MENPRKLNHTNLLIEFALRMDSVYDTFTKAYFNDKVKDIDLSDRLKDHFFGKMIDLNMIKESGITLNDQTSYYIPYAVSDVLRVMKGEI